MSDDDEDLVAIYVDLPDHDPPTGERMWAKALGDDLYELRNVPFDAYALNWGDVVHATAPSADEAPQMRSVARRGGHRTVRVIVNDERLGTQEKQELFDRLNALHAFYEHADGRLYCLDVEPEADYDQVRDLLVAQHDAGALIFEEAWRGSDDDEAPQPEPDWL